MEATKRHHPGAEPMKSLILLQGAVYRHIQQPQRACPLACPQCHRSEVQFHSFRTRTVEHLDPEHPCYLVLTLAKSACPFPDCPRRYFTPPVVEVASYSHTSRSLQRTAVGLYRSGKNSLEEIQKQMRQFWHTGTGKSSILRWHQES